MMSLLDHVLQEDNVKRSHFSLQDP
jgi:hypothetical protein